MSSWELPLRKYDSRVGEDLHLLEDVGQGVEVNEDVSLCVG